jgi:hypothetical protein
MAHAEVVAKFMENAEVNKVAKKVNKGGESENNDQT